MRGSACLVFSPHYLEKTKKKAKKKKNPKPKKWMVSAQCPIVRGWLEDSKLEEAKVIFG